MTRKEKPAANPEDIRKVIKNYFEERKPIRPKNLFVNVFGHLIKQGYGSCTIGDFRKIYMEEFEEYYKH
ncbi:MAG: hypothetical protein NTY20_00760 [Candidatus Aenigmarchaeota archaeon]|nr:hypothetical protein [Candidatus Aenigmarchaeota archaeon]